MRKKVTLCEKSVGKTVKKAAVLTMRRYRNPKIFDNAQVKWGFYRQMAM